MVQEIKINLPDELPQKTDPRTFYSPSAQEQSHPREELLSCWPTFVIVIPTLVFDFLK
jgi:hypothetical protein